jgi:hypothetical protein
MGLAENGEHFLQLWNWEQEEQCLSERSGICNTDAHSFSSGCRALFTGIWILMTLLHGWEKRLLPTVCVTWHEWEWGLSMLSWELMQKQVEEPGALNLQWSKMRASLSTISAGAWGNALAAQTYLSNPSTIAQIVVMSQVLNVTWLSCIHLSVAHEAIRC